MSWSGASTILKKPKVEEEEEANGNHNNNKEDENTSDTSRQEQEEALLALIEHRTKEVEHLKYRISYYKTQVFFSFSPPLRKSISLFISQSLDLFI